MIQYSGHSSGDRGRRKLWDVLKISCKIFTGDPWCPVVVRFSLLAQVETETSEGTIPSFVHFRGTVAIKVIECTLLILQRFHFRRKEYRVPVGLSGRDF